MITLVLIDSIHSSTDITFIVHTHAVLQVYNFMRFGLFEEVRNHGVGTINQHEKNLSPILNISCILYKACKSSLTTEKLLCANSK